MNPSSNCQDPELQQPEVLNEELVAAYSEANEGQLKNASALNGQYIRRRIRENGFQRRILPFEPLKQSDLTQSLTSELPHVIEEMEGEQPGAVSVNYNDTPDTQFFRGDKFAVYLHLIMTREYTKNVFELMTYKHDLRELTNANMLKDIHTQEDTKFMGIVDAIVGETTGLGAGGIQQNFEITGRASRENYVEHKNHLEDQALNNGIFLCNRRQANEFLKWGRDELGGDRAQDLALEGMEALTEFKFFGIPHIATIKKTLVPDNFVYKFAEPGFLGRAYRLQDITTFVKKEKNVIRSYAQECVGLTIANVKAVMLGQHVL